MRRPLARSLVLGRPGLFYGPAVRDYLDRVRAADGDGLSRGVTNGINAYLSGLITAQMLGTSGGVISQAASTIKAHCILAGANTLSGALVPVVGSAPTNNNFVSGDYNRKTGLVGNGSTKYLGSNRNNNADPQDNKHLSVYKSSTPTSNGALIGTNTVTSGASWIFESQSATDAYRVNASPSVTFPFGTYPDTGFVGVSRSSSSQSSRRYSGATITDTSTSQPPIAEEVRIFVGANSLFYNGSIRSYTIGESINLAILESLQDQLVAALNAAIP